MTRTRLPERRRGLTEVLTHLKGEEHEKEFSVTFNWEEGGRVKEVFALAFKEGTELRTMLHHSCIITSLALQHGNSMADLAHMLGEDDPNAKPGSIMGLIVRAGVAIDIQRGFTLDAEKEAAQWP